MKSSTSLPSINRARDGASVQPRIVPMRPPADLSQSTRTKIPHNLERCREQKVLLAPGNAFATRPGPSPFARAAFSIASDEVIDEALARLGAVLREVKAESENGVEATESITNEQ